MMFEVTLRFHDIPSIKVLTQAVPRIGELVNTERGEFRVFAVKYGMEDTIDGYILKPSVYLTLP